MRYYSVKKNAIFALQIKTPASTKINYSEEVKTIGGKNYIPFGTTNNHPFEIRSNYIDNYTVLAASINYKVALLVGQGLFAAKILGYKENGAEILEPTTNPEIINFLNGKNINSYLKKAAKNLVAFGNVFPELILNETQNKILGIYEKSAINARWGVDDNFNINNILVVPDWSTADAKYLKAITTLNFDDPLLDLKTNAKKYKNVGYINSMYDSQFYYIPNFETAINSKWVDLALKTPVFLNASYENALNVAYFIKIPELYFDLLYPKSEYKDEQKRIDLIDAYIDDISKELTSVENARKTITSIGVKDPNTNEYIYWQLEVIKDSVSFQKDILASDAADNQLTNTFLINDAVFLKKTSGGMGGGSGSDIREAHLINVSMLKPERDIIIEPLELIRDFNGWDSNLVFRFRDSILTTLDTNAGTADVVS